MQDGKRKPRRWLSGVFADIQHGNITSFAYKHYSICRTEMQYSEIVVTVNVLGTEFSLRFNHISLSSISYNYIPPAR